MVSCQVKTKFVCGSEDKIAVSFPHGLNDNMGRGAADAVWLLGVLKFARLQDSYESLLCPSANKLPLNAG